MNVSLLSRTWIIVAALPIGVAVFVAAWWLHPRIAESAHTPAEPIVIQPLTAPAGFAATEENPDTAFRESEAGISAYYRVPTQEGADGQSGSVRLDVNVITNKLTNAPDESDEVRTGAGKEVDIGLNFGIIELPMRAAVTDSQDPTETITVYYDDQGWIVAYLPKGTPAAAIWQYKVVQNTTNNGELENNLLVLAINEVLKADNADAAKVGHDKVKYYDWANESCNAFVLFSAVANDSASQPVKFVVPSAITEIGASAAVVITGPIDQGGVVSATIVIDEDRVPANANYPRNAAGFKLAREANKTSLHEMTVYVSEGNQAAGVVMLVYAKP